MNNKYKVLGLVSIALSGAMLGGCHAEAKFGNPEVQSAPPPPPPPTIPPPPPAPAPVPVVGRVQLSGNHIEIKEQIQFDKAGAHIKPESAALLDEIAKAMKDNDAKIKKVEVAGHTSSEGEAASNMKLSQDRASAVMSALVERGIDKSKLVAKGYGVTKPIGDNADEAGKIKNRRVEFTLLDK